MVKKMTPDEILLLSMPENDAGARTIGGYLKKLLAALWTDGEAFSGKRPFGNSGWDYDLYAALVRGGAVEGALDEDGFVDDFDKESADKLIFAAIDYL